MNYDPSTDALFRPEQTPPLNIEPAWPVDGQYAELARLAYFRFEQDPAQKQVLTDALGAAGFPIVEVFGDPRDPAERFRLGAHAYAAITPGGEAVIAFRGTQPDSFRDIVADAYFVPTQWSGSGHVHSGFWESFSAVWPAIKAWLTTNKPKKLVVTGHSLGAAQASLLAGLVEAELVTFGSPRVGDAVFASSFKNGGRTVRRYVDCMDIVTLVPPAPYYVHLDGLRYIDAKRIVHDPAVGMVSIAADWAEATMEYIPFMWHPNNVHIRGLADHAPINYIGPLLGGIGNAI